MATALLAGWIVVHAAMPAVLANHPERADPTVAGYVAVSDCAMIGQRLVLVRPGQPDALVAVADCAWEQHVAYREANGLIADVDEAIWEGPWIPQPAELWLPEARAALLAALADVPRQVGPLWAM